MRSELPPLLQNHAGLSAQVQLHQFTPEDLASYFRKSKQEFQRLELYLRAGEEKAAITLWFSIYVLLQLERNFQQGSDSSLGYYSTWPLNTTLHEQGYLRTGKNLGCIRKYSGGNIKILYSVFTLNSTQFPQKVSYNKAIYTSKFKQGLAVKSLAAKAACFDQFRLTFGLKKATNSAENQRGARAGNPASPEPSQAQGCSECSLAPHKEIAVPPFFFFSLQRGQWGLGRAEQVCYCTWSQDEDCIFSSTLYNTLLVLITSCSYQGFGPFHSSLSSCHSVPYISIRKSKPNSFTLRNSFISNMLLPNAADPARVQRGDFFH